MAMKMAWFTDQFSMVAGVSSWICCSVGMMIFNKMAVHAFPMGCTLVIFQMAFSAVFLLVFAFRTLHFGSWRDVLKWSLVVPFFAGMLLSSILALKHASMTLVVTFRAITPVLSLIIERFYPKPPKVTIWVLLCLAMLIVGAGIYTIGMSKAESSGIGFVIMNNFFALADRLIQRMFLSKDQHPVDISLTGCTLQNNVLGIIPMVIVAAIIGEFKQVPEALHAMGAQGIVMVVLSCVVGMGISYTGIWAQSMITATSFLVLVNANKFFIIILEAYILKSKHLGPIQVVAAVITIVAGILYGRAFEHANPKEPAAKTLEDSEKEPILKKV